MSLMKSAIAATLLSLAALSAPAVAADEYNTSSGLTAAGSPLGDVGTADLAAAGRDPAPL